MTTRSVSTTRKEDVPFFGPKLVSTFDATSVDKGDLKKFLLTKGTEMDVVVYCHRHHLL